ncbi:MAG: hypothetical protein ABSH47_19730 [Bryobacteraceae bacterium]|jgi:hypothetical protein
MHKVVKEYWNAPFYPDRNTVGRKLESAIFGGPDGNHVDVKPVIEALRAGELVAVNQYELCHGQDPYYGREKFLTVTLSETVAEGAVFMSPAKWLTGTSNIRVDNDVQPIPPAELPMYHSIRNDFSLLTYSQRFAAKRILDCPGRPKMDVQRELSEMGFGKPDLDIGQLLYRNLVEEVHDGYRPSPWLVKFHAQLLREFPLGSRGV